MNRQNSQSEPKWMLQLVLDTITIRVFWKNRDSVYLGCNLLFATDAGLSSPDEIVGKTDYDMPWTEQAELYRADDRLVMESGVPKLDYEEPQTTPDGRTIWLRTSKIPLKDADGNIIGIAGTYEDITRRRHIEENLRESESFYRAMFEKSPFPLGLNRMNGEFIDVNERWVQLTGIPRENIIGHTAAEAGLVDKVMHQRVVDEVMRTGGMFDRFEMTYLTRDGKLRYALLSSGLVHMKGETVSLTILNDITERKQAEMELQKSEEKYRELVQSANSIILRWGLDCRVKFFNEYAQSFFGFKESEILGRSVIGTIVPETESSGRDLVAMMSDILSHPERHETNINENMRKNGERVWVAWTNKPVFDEHGQFEELLSVGLDVTARKHAEDALLESEMRYKSIFNSNVDAFLLFDLDGRIVDANNRAAALYGYSHDELIGMSGNDIVSPECYHIFNEFRNTATGEWFDKESMDVRKDGTPFDVEIHGTRLRYGGQERLLAIVFDVTERNKAKESMQLFTDVVRNMQTGLYIYHLEDLDDDSTLKLTATNPASTTALGLKPEDIEGKYIDEIFPGLRAQNITERFADVVRTGEPFSIDDFLYSDARITRRHFAFKAFYVPGNRVGILFEDITDIIHAEEEKRRFYRKTIEAATEGKLIICEHDEIKEIAGSPIVSYPITSEEDLHGIRRMVTGIAESMGMDGNKVYDLVLCVGEATTNVIKHAHSGIISAHHINDSLMVIVSDKGTGIQAINLPDVALKAGYTTAISLGMGYKAMISIADQIYLATGPDGTTVGIEMRLHPKPVSPSVIALPDTW